MRNAKWMGWLSVLVVLALGGCGQKEQTVSANVRKTDAPVWQGGQTATVAPGWRPGDQASWEAQMRTRNQSQNDYARMP